MIRHGDLFCQIIHPENLKTAHKNARKGKSYYQEVRMVDENPDYYISEIHHMLASGTYKTSEYSQKEIYKPKQRTIHKLPYYPDRIVHHAIMQVIQPIWDNVFIYDLYSAIPGKGLHAGSYRVRKFLKDVPNTQYCLKFDISKFYPSMDHDVLIRLISKKIKCKDTLKLLEEVIRSVPGVPIGNYLSQYFSNIYLNEFDHWIKEVCGIKYYVRYCDDGVIFHSDRGYLKQLLDTISGYLTDLHLKLNPKTNIYPIDKCGVDFLGYRHYRSHIRLRKSSVRNLKLRVKEIEQGKINSDLSIVSSVMSSLGWLMHCNAHNLATKLIFENHTIMRMMMNSSENLNINNPMEKLTWQNRIQTQI